MKEIICCLLLLVAPVSSHALEGIGAGNEPPRFSLPTRDGALISSNAFAGGPGVIVFWSTWSPRSAEVLDDLRAYHEQWGAKGLKVIAVNCDKEHLSGADRQEVLRAAAQLRLPFPVVFDEGLRTYAAYGVMALPSTLILGADGKIAYTLAGYPFTYRDELREQLAFALGEGKPDVPLASAGAAVGETEPAGAAAAPRTSCVLPRAQYCRFDPDRELAGSSPEVMAMRLAICRGDAKEAERLISRGVIKRVDSADARFALAELMLLKGGAAEAGTAFDALRRRFPDEAWGAWGLGMLALADGRELEALAHMRAAAALGGVCVEAETAVLHHLQAYWVQQRQSPAEAGFLSLFTKLAAVRDCFTRQRPPG